MKRYIEQLLGDIADATENVSFPFAEQELNLHDWISEEEKDRTAPDLQIVCFCKLIFTMSTLLFIWFILITGSK